MRFDFLHPRRSSVRQEEILLRDSEFLLFLLRFHCALYFIHVDARIIAIVAHLCCKERMSLIKATYEIIP